MSLLNILRTVAPEGLAGDDLAVVGRRAALLLEILVAGPDIWTRLPLTAETSEIVRQRLDALLDQFLLAGLQNEAAVQNDLRRARQSPEFQSAALDRFFELRSLDKQSLVGEVAAYFAKATAARPPLSWGNLDAIAPSLIENELAWTAALDRPETPPAPKSDDAVLSLIARGVERLQSGDYRQAITHFTAGLRLDPTHADLYVHRGDAYRLLGEAQRALADYHAALHVQPELTSALLGRAVASRDVGDFATAFADASAVLRVSDRQPLAFRTRAAAALELGDFQQAADDLSAALALDDDDIDARHDRGRALYELGEHARAIDDFNRVLARNPNHVSAMLHRGHARRLLGDQSRAVRDYSDVLRHHPANALALTCRGLAHELSGDRDGALADFTEALRLEPDNIQIAFNRAKLQRVTGDLAGARADLDDVITRQPEHYAALYHRGKVALARGQWRQSLDDLDAALAAKPDLGVAYASRAIIHDRLGHFTAALEDAGRAIELEPKLAIVHLVRGIVNNHLRDLAAIDDLTTALELDDQLPLAYQERSVAFTIQGDFDAALADANRLVILEPGNALAYTHRSMLLHLRGDVQPALVDYNTALRLDPRVLIANLSQPFAEHARSQTTILLADAIDGLRSRRSYPSAPPAAEWEILVEKPRRGQSLPRAPREDRDGGPRDERPSAGPRREPPAEPEASATIAIAPPPPRRAADTTPSTAALERTAENPAVVEKPTAKKKAERPAAAKPTQVAKIEAPVTPTADDDVTLEPEDELPDISELDDAVANLLAQTDATLSAEPQIEPQKPAPPPAAANLKMFDCPLCRKKNIPAQMLPGGRIRCGNCDAISFPIQTTTPPASQTIPAPRPFPSSPTVKSQPVKPKPPVKPAKRVVVDDDNEPTLLDKWKRPAPLAGTVVLLLILVYMYFPTNLFGGSSRLTVNPAQGEVQYEGKAIPGALVLLHPVNPKNDDFPRPQGLVGPDGSFQLGTYGPDDGAPAGEYKVTVVWNSKPTPKEEKEDRFVMRNLLPHRYANPETSGLVTRIEAGENKLPAIILRKNK